MSTEDDKVETHAMLLYELELLLKNNSGLSVSKEDGHAQTPKIIKTDQQPSVKVLSMKI